MKILLLLILQLSSLFPCAYAKVKVFACEPEWAALTKELAGDYADVYTATTAQQDPHFIQARPSLIARARSADLLFCTGAELEIGWLPIILRKSANARIQPGRPGHLMAADWVKKLEVPSTLDRSHGDVHSMGNPHIQTDARNIGLVARELVKRLIILDAVHAQEYAGRLNTFNKQWSDAIESWQSKAEPLNGMPVIAYHNSWVYLEKWLGLQVLSFLEPKPGIAPSAAHLTELVQQAKHEQPLAVMYASNQSMQAAQWYANQTGVRLVELPFTVGGTTDAPDLYAFYESVIDRLLAVLK